MDSFIPEVVDDSGNPVVGPPLDAVLNRVSNFAVLANLARIRKAVEKGGDTLVKIQHDVERDFVKGELFAPVLAASQSVQTLNILDNQLNYPLLPLATATFFNDGPNPVFIIINDSVNPFSLNMGDYITIDFSRADERITLIKYWCAIGNTASVRVVGKY